MTSLTTLDIVQKVYQIQLSEAELSLLTSSNGLLSPLDQQRKHILTRALERITCPACRGLLCLYSAANGGYGRDEPHGDDDYTCPFCKALLHYWLDYTGHQGFDLQPGQVITTGPRETAE